MRKIPAPMQAKLDAGATTFCACWRIDPAWGGPLGFTDHDEDIEFDGVRFEASSGFSGGALERSLGLAIDNTTATGALRSDRITEADIARGRFDGAGFRLWLVDWRAPSSRLLTFSGEIGEIARGALAFEAEIRGLSEPLNRPIGRRYLHVCDAKLGDGRCRVDAASPAFRTEGAVVSVVSGRVKVSGLGGFAQHWFSDGELKWTDGPNAPRIVGVRSHRREEDGVYLEMDRAPVDGVNAGDAFVVTAGCDKRAATCREKFGNLINFRGFPHMPGENWLTAYPVDGGVYRGGSLGGD